MARKSGHISILQFDEQLISRLRVSTSAKGLEILKHDVRRGSWSATDEGLSSAVRDFAKEVRLSEDRVFTVLPRHAMTARILLLPSHDAREIESMVRLSVEEYVPYPEHELVLDQAVLQRFADGQSRVLAVFAHRDIVEDHVRVLRASGIEPEQILVSTACLASAAILARGSADERFALIHLASGGVEVLILHGNRLEYGRGVATVQDWGEATQPGSEALEELAAELRATLSAHRREVEDASPIERVYMCSEWLDSAGVATALSDFSGVECVPARFAATLVSRGNELLTGLPLASLGAALNAQERTPIAITLVPESLELVRKRSAVKRTALRLGGGILAFVLCLAALYGQAAIQRANYIAELQSRIAEAEPVALSVEAKRKKLIRLQQHLDRRGSALELLARLTELSPVSGLNIMRFTFAYGEGLTITGRAESLTLVDALAEALREAGRNDVPQFSRAGLGPYKAETEQNQPVIQYEITIPFATQESSEPGAQPAAGEDELP
ncbi:MAG: pilus assembly protein PilM [Candidatus Hydrogenedentes bacterium]|nr:pilus assembly protein PilM [Candidatus Hydrogenedentota bacterium]